MSRDPIRQRETRAEVDLGALAHNLRVLREASARRVYGVVKADAYGHGMLPVARTLEQQGADGLCVALAEEGFSLRAAGISLPILVMGASHGDRDSHARMLGERLTPVVHSLAHARAFAAVSDGQPVSVHLKVDTGMSRLGVALADLPALLDGLAGLPGVHLEGVMTHLSSADSDHEATTRQLDRFDAALASIRAHGHAPTLVHAANSAGALNYRRARFDMVRPGIALYGVQPSVPAGAAHEHADAAGGKSLRSVLSLHSEVAAVRELPAGTAVGYDETFHTSRPSRIATVPIGYGDGLLRAASNRGAMLVHGQRCPIVGRVSMDLTTLDVTDLPTCEVGDHVTVIGSQGGASLDAEDLAAACDTIAYEVLTLLTPRVPRVYQ